MQVGPPDHVYVTTITATPSMGNDTRSRVNRFHRQGARIVKRTSVGATALAVLLTDAGYTYGVTMERQ